MNLPQCFRNENDAQDPADLIRLFHQYRDSYGKDIAVLEEKLRAGLRPQRYFRPFPVDNRQHLCWILAYLKKQSVDTGNLESEMAVADEEFFRIRETFHDTYFITLGKMLQVFISVYVPSSGCSNIPCGYKNPVQFETRIRERDYIEAIKNEIEPEVEISNELARLDECDKRFIWNIPASVKNQTYCPLDLYYAPREIWWRHLVEKYGKPTGFREAMMYFD